MKFFFFQSATIFYFCEHFPYGDFRCEEKLEVDEQLFLSDVGELSAYDDPLADDIKNENVQDSNSYMERWVMWIILL